MRLVDLSLTGVTLAIAGVALYLATLVAAERERANTAAEQRQSLEARVQGLERARARDVHPASLTHSTAPAASARTGAAAPNTAASTTAEKPRGPYEILGPTLEEQLAQLVDPTIRPTMLRLRQDRERVGNPGLRHELHLSAEEENQLFALLAEQDLRNEEQEIRDAIAGRRSTDDSPPLAGDLEEKLGTLLGEERARQFHEYQASLPERENIVDLRSRLGGGPPLTDAAAKQLSDTMREERDRFAAETRRLAGGRGNDAYPEYARLNSEDLAARLKFREEQIARTAEYYARIRERATSFLSVQQLQRLEELHEANLATLRANLIRGRSVETEMNQLRAAPPPTDR